MAYSPRISKWRKMERTKHFRTLLNFLPSRLVGHPPHFCPQWSLTAVFCWHCQGRRNGLPQYLHSPKQMDASFETEAVTHYPCVPLILEHSQPTAHKITLFKEPRCIPPVSDSLGEHVAKGHVEIPHSAVEFSGSQTSSPVKDDGFLTQMEERCSSLTQFLKHTFLAQSESRIPEVTFVTGIRQGSQSHKSLYSAQYTISRAKHTNLT